MYIPIAILVVLLLSGLRVAQEDQRGVVFRLGRFTGVRGPGLFWIIPLGIERWVNIDIRISTERWGRFQNFAVACVRRRDIVTP